MTDKAGANGSASGTEESAHARSQSLVGNRGSAFQTPPTPVFRRRKKKKWDIMESVCPCLTSSFIFLSCTSTIVALVCPWFYANMPPQIAYPIMAVLGFTTMMTIVNFSYASCMNPGFLPKTTEMRYIRLQPAFVMIKGTRTQLKMCRTCHYFRMPRTVHCSQCDYCVDCFDHHCPWVNNCIGRRNYRNFFAFVSTLTVHILLCVGICVTFLVFRRNENWDGSMVAIAVVTAIAGLIAVPVGGLLGFHCFLIYNGLTTYEHVSNKYEHGENPFDMGPCSNCAFELCGPEFPVFEPVYPSLQNMQEGEGEISSTEAVQRELIANFAAASKKKGPGPGDQLGLGASTVVVEIDIPTEADLARGKKEVAFLGVARDEQNNNNEPPLPLHQSEQLTVKVPSGNNLVPGIGPDLALDAGGDIPKLEVVVSSVVIEVQAINMKPTDEEDAAAGIQPSH